MIASESVPSDAQMRRLLERTRTIAVVGISQDPGRPSYGVAEYLAAHGYRIVPINPSLSEWNGLKAHPTLEAAKQAGETIDLVDVFRRPEFVPEIVESAIRVGAKAVWLQLDVVHEEAAKRASGAGLEVVMDRCTRIEHRRLLA